MKRVGVAITGTLSAPRKVVSARINASSNGCYHDCVKVDTHYLVSSIQDSGKVRDAAKRGTAIISERELDRFVAEDHFPPTELPNRPQHVSNLPDIAWETIASEPEIWCIGYTDAQGEFSIRTVAITGFGATAGKPEVRWIGAYDGPNFKTFRRDRISFICKPEEVAGVAF